MWELVLLQGCPLELRHMLVFTFTFGTGMRPGEPLADTTTPSRPLRTLGDWIFTPSGLIALYLGETKTRLHAWAVNILDFLLRIFVIYITEMVTTIPGLTGLSPLFLGKYMPSKKRYQQISKRQHRAFIRGKLIQLGICEDEEDAQRYSSYSTRSGLVESLEDIGIPRWVVAMFTRHASNSIMHYERPSSRRLLARLQKAYAIAQNSKNRRSGEQQLEAMIESHYKNCEVAKLEPTRGLLTSPRMDFAPGIRPFLNMTPSQSNKIRKSVSGALEDMAFDQHSLHAFVEVMHKLPHTAAFFADYGMPLHYDVQLEGPLLGRTKVKSLTRAAQDKWHLLNRQPHARAPSFLTAHVAQEHVSSLFRTSSTVLKPGVQATPLLTARQLFDSLGVTESQPKPLVASAPDPLAWERAKDPLGLRRIPRRLPRRHTPARPHLTGRKRELLLTPQARVPHHASPHTSHRRHLRDEQETHHRRRPLKTFTEPQAPVLPPHQLLSPSRLLKQKHFMLKSPCKGPRKLKNTSVPAPPPPPSPQPVVTPAGTPPIFTNMLTWDILEAPPLYLRENRNPEVIPSPPPKEEGSGSSEDHALCPASATKPEHSLK